MLLDIVQKGATDRSVVLRIISATDGTPETGVAYNTSGIDLWYRREGAAVTSITEATLAALTTAHADGGFLHVSHGYYRLDLPDAAFATGANYVDIGGTVTGMVVIGGRVRLVDINVEDAVRGGLTALPNANAEAAGGLYTRGTGAGQINQPANGRIAVDTTHLGGTSQTGRDLGASVLLSPGTGTGQISLSSGAVLLQATQTGVTIPTVTTLTNAPSDSSGVTTLLSRLSSARAGYLDNLSGGAVALASSLTSAAGDITSILGKFTGITSLAQWLGLIAGKQTGNSTARTELRATGAGSGTFDETTDSVEAIRDRGDAAWVTGAAAPSAADVADAVWDEATIGHTTTGTFGRNLDGRVSVVGGDVLTNGVVLGLIEAVTTPLGDTLEDDGGTYRFTANALEQAPTGGSAPSASDIADAVWDEALSGHTTPGSAGDTLGNVATGTPPTAAAIADAVWDEAASGHVTGGTFGAAVADILTDTGTTLQGELDGIQADTEDIQSRIPAALISGRLDVTVGAMQANVMTAAAAASDLTTELQSGLATASALSTVSGLVDDLETRLTSTRAGYLDNLSAGAVAQQASVDTLEASAAAIEADTQDIQSRLPAALVGGRMDATVDATGMEAGAIDAILDDTIGDGTLTMRQALRVLVAGMAGKLSGGGTTTVTIRNVADSANVIVATVDADGNRSAVTVTP